jgi:peptidoglycan/LPS O-acetylase OafA/YrhL
MVTPALSAALDQPSQRETGDRKHLPALDGLRGIAIISVFLFHFGGGAQSSHLLVRVTGTIRQAGWMGVDLFFVLSGFLITGILFDSRTHRGYFRNFYARRALRLFPLFYGAALLLVLLTRVLHIEWRPGHIAYLFYGANIAGYLDPGLNGPAPYFGLYHLWSLAVEEQFYLIWPLVVLLAKTRKTLIWICIGVILATPALRVALDLSGAVNTSFLYMETVCRMDSLAFGGLVALVLRIPRFAIPRYLYAVLIAFSALAAAIIVRHEHSVLSSTQWMATIGFSAIAIGCSGVLLGTLQAGTLVHRLASIPALRLTGTYSYGIYVYHVLLEPLCRNGFRVLQRELPQWIAGLVYLALSFALVFMVSAISYEWFEKPIMRYKSGFRM